MASPKIRLETNIPFLATVKYCDFYDEKPNPNEPGKMMSAQWGLKGNFVRCNPDGTRDLLDGVVYLDTYQLSADPVQLGLAAPNGLRDGKPQFKWLHAGQIQLVKREDGRKRIIQIARVGDASPMAAAPPYNPTAPQQAVMAGQARNTSGVPSPMLSGIDLGPSPHAERRASAGQNPADYADHDPWAALEARYARCFGIARRVLGMEDRLHDPASISALIAATATLFIEANKERLQVETTYPNPLTATAQAMVSTAVITDTSGPPRPEQIAQFRALLGTDDPYGGGPILTPAERTTWLMVVAETTTAQDFATLIQRVQKVIATRTTKPQAATRTAGGPGMPGAGFEQMPEALDPELDTLPF